MVVTVLDVASGCWIAGGIEARIKGIMVMAAWLDLLGF
jgi:hypothetical protein